MDPTMSAPFSAFAPFSVSAIPETQENNAMREYAMIMTILVLVIGAGKVNQRKVDLVVSGKLGVATASWWGFDPEDSTDALQAAINSSAKKLIVDNVGKPWVVRPIKLASNQGIVFAPGVEVIAKQGEFKGKGDCLFVADGREKITLTGYGATLRMRRTDYAGPAYEKSEWRHALSIRSCSNITIRGLTIAESGGDGIYLGTSKSSVTNKDVHIKDVVCDRNHRQGISVITAENLLIEDTVMRDTAGTLPQAGIDFEPNSPTERLVNIVMRKCTTERNRGQGYDLYLKQLDSTSAPVSVRFEKCVSIGDNDGSVRVTTGNAPKQAVTGKIEFIDCTFKTGTNAGVVISNVPVTGCKVRFVNCSILDPAAGKPKSAPIVFQSGRDATAPIGGVEFADCAVRDSLDRNPLIYIDGGGSIPLRAVSGTIDLQRRGARQTIEITPRLLEEWDVTSETSHTRRSDETTER